MFGKLTSQSKLITLKGTVVGNSLVTGISTQYLLKGDKLYHGKKGYFLVCDGIVYNYLRCN